MSQLKVRYFIFVLENVVKLFTLEETEKKAFVKVSNSGRLIDSVVGSKLFDPFFTTKQPGQGTGLGLSIVSNIVKEHGGEIRFVNLKDGVEFIVTLPAD